MKTNTLHSRQVILLCGFLLGFFGVSWGQTSLNLIAQDAYFPTQFNSGGDFFDQSSTVLGMWANQNAKQTVAWRNFKTTGDNSGADRTLQIGDEFSITVSCTRAFGQIGFSLNAGGSQGGSYANSINGSKLRINTDNYGSWYISNGSTAASFNYNPSENTYRDYKFVVKILSPSLITASLFVNGSLHSSIQNFGLLNNNAITAFSIYGSDMWDGSSNDNAFWKDCNVTATTTVELGYGLASGNLSPGLLTNGLLANSTSSTSINSVFVGGNSGSSVILDQANIFTGLTTINTNATLQLNKTGGATLPSGNSITVNNGGTLRISSHQILNNLTINSGGTVIVDAGVQLTITGALTNNGTFSLENGATFVQGNSVTGGGTYNVRQNLDNCATNGTSLTGRFWYLGSPVTSLRETSFGNTGALNKVWSFTNGAYTAITDGTTLVPTTGYVHRRGANASPLTFSGTNLYASDVTLSLSNNAGTYAGWHLIANPYTAYLDWQQVYNASYALSSAISPSYYIRSFNSTGNDVNALITYNSSTGLESNTSSFSLGSTGSTIARYIAPMQAFWVKVNPTTPLSATAGQLRLERAFTSHQTGNVGLKSSTIFPTLARVNLVDGGRFDQMLVYMNSDMTNGVDQYDSEKMFVSGAPQIYTVAAGKKLVMNGLKDNKKKSSVPLYLELSESKIYKLQLAEYILEDGLILLEDKQEGTIQDFTIHDEYTFYANSGVLANRFVLHFYMPDNGITAQGPSNSWVEEETVINEGGNILVNSNGRGKVSILQDIDPSPAAKGNVIVRDAAGRQVWKGQLSGSATLIELDTPSGIYFVEVELNGQVEMKKIFVQ